MLTIAAKVFGVQYYGVEKNHDTSLNRLMMAHEVSDVLLRTTMSFSQIAKDVTPRSLCANPHPARPSSCLQTEIRVVAVRVVEQSVFVSQ